jgi:hypothetical protein
VHCVGWADKEQDDKLRVDHIFLVFSNTKLITSCAAMLLFEEGRYQLDDPIEQYLPQLANRLVLRPDATSLDDSEPARSPITIRHDDESIAGRCVGPLSSVRRDSRQGTRACGFGYLGAIPDRSQKTFKTFPSFPRWTSTCPWQGSVSAAFLRLCCLR